MRRVLGFVLLLSVTLHAPATGQDKQKRQYFHRAEVLVYVKGIDEELKLGKAESEKARKLIDEVSDKHQAALDQARKDPDNTKWRGAVDKVVEETDTALATVLTAKQMGRLTQVLRQRYAFQTFRENADALKLTADQQQTIERQSRGLGKKSLSPAEYKAIVDLAVALLTPEQRKAWDALVGPWYLPPNP